MKFKLDKKYFKIAVYAVIVIVISGLLLRWFNVIPDLSQIFSFIGGAISPVIWGIVIAYILQPCVKFFEYKVFKKWNDKISTKKQRERIRSLSVLITVIATLALITGVCWLALPQLIDSCVKIFDKIPIYLSQLQNWATEAFKDNPEMIKIISDPISQLEGYFNDLWEVIQPELTSVLSGVGVGVWRVVIGFKDFIIGFIFAVYFLYAREMFVVQIKKIMFAFVENNHCQKILEIYRKSNNIFRDFIVGKLLDSFIIGVLCFIGCLILQMPFAALIAVIVGVTNVIPVFGPFIGAIPSVFFVLMEDPMQALWLAIFILILQQFDGNILGPYILGDKTGLPAVWVLIAIIIGGGAFGFMGMLLAVPVFAVIYMLCREFVNYRLNKKQLPTVNTVYEGDVEQFKSDYVYTEEQRHKDEEEYKKLFSVSKKITQAKDKIKSKKDKK